jgi:hypothetical protein
LPAHCDRHLFVVVYNYPSMLVVPRPVLQLRRLGESWPAGTSAGKGRGREERLQDVGRLALQRLYMLLTIFI